LAALTVCSLLVRAVVKAERPLTIRVSVADRRGDVPFTATLEPGR
jgi:hypothetical protein